MSDAISIPGFAGSLRAGSYNRSLIRAQRLAPAGDGLLTDEPTAKYLGRYLEAFAA